MQIRKNSLRKLTPCLTISPRIGANASRLLAAFLGKQIVRIETEAYAYGREVLPAPEAIPPRVIGAFMGIDNSNGRLISKSGYFAVSLVSGV